MEYKRMIIMKTMLRQITLAIFASALLSGCAALDIAIDLGRIAVAEDHARESLYAVEDVDGNDGTPPLSHQRRAMYVRINQLAAHGKSRIEFVDGTVYEGRSLHVWADSTLFRAVEKRIEVQQVKPGASRSRMRMRPVASEWIMVPTEQIARLAVGPPRGRVATGRIIGGVAGAAAFAGLASVLFDNQGFDDGNALGDMFAVALLAGVSIGTGAAVGNALASKREVFDLTMTAHVAGAPSSMKSE